MSFECLSSSFCCSAELRAVVAAVVVFGADFEERHTLVSGRCQSDMVFSIQILRARIRGTL